MAGEKEKGFAHLSAVLQKQPYTINIDSIQRREPSEFVKNFLLRNSTSEVQVPLITLVMVTNWLSSMMLHFDCPTLACFFHKQLRFKMCPQLIVALAAAFHRKLFAFNMLSPSPYPNSKRSGYSTDSPISTRSSPPATPICRDAHLICLVKSLLETQANIRQQAQPSTRLHSQARMATQMTQGTTSTKGAYRPSEHSSTSST